MFKILIIILCLQMATPSFGATKAGPVEFKDNFILNQTEMRLSGAGFKKFLNFKVLSVALYVGNDHTPTDVLKNVPKRLEVVYLLGIPKAELDRATSDGIAQNVDEATFKKLKPRIDQINSYYRDVKPFDRIAITYIPEEGCRVTFNDQFRGIVKGEDFARAFFAIWVGDNPVDQKIKNKLLGMEALK